MAPKKGAAAAIEAKEELKAVLLADTFAQEFLPITVEKPKALLPLVNVPLIDYSLEWLAANNVEEVYVFCCTHADQIKAHIADARWNSKGIKITVVVSSSSRSIGDALRMMDSRGGIGSDFVLMYGDTVTNLDLGAHLREHKARREKDRNAIMTLVTKQVSGDSAQTRLGCDPLIVSLDPATGRLLRYQEVRSRRRQTNMDAHFWGERDSVQLRADLMDCEVAICAPEVLMLFSDNFDYQDVKGDFIPGVLSEEELGNKLHVHVLRREYAARARNLRAYDAISRDVLQRWAFPFVPDTNLFGGSPSTSTYTFHRQNVYREQGVSVARDAAVLYDTVIGSGTHIDSGAVVSTSVIGRGCRIGRGVHIQGSYVHDKVTVWEGADVQSAMLCEGVTVMPNAKILPGAVISFKAVIGAGQIIGPNKRISLCRAVRALSDSDDERQAGSPAAGLSAFGSAESNDAGFGEQPSAAFLSGAAAAAAGNSLPDGVGFDETAVGRGGAGFEWDVQVDEQRLASSSLAQPPPWVPNDGNSSDEASVATVEDIASEAADPTEGAVETVFKQEVSETVLRCVKDGHSLDNAIVELNGLKIAENKTFADVSRYVLSTILALCLTAPLGLDPEYKSLFPAAMPANDSELLKRLLKVTKEWGRLVKQYLKGPEEQVDLLLSLEEFCSEEAPFGPSSHGSRFVPLFPRILQLLYDEDYILEDSFLEWAEEKQDCDEEEKRFLHLAKPFIEWLQNADEETEDEEEDEDSD